MDKIQKPSSSQITEAMPCAHSLETGVTASVLFQNKVSLFQNSINNDVLGGSMKTPDGTQFIYDVTEVKLFGGQFFGLLGLRLSTPW
jgi:hypothetical protein